MRKTALLASLSLVLSAGVGRAQDAVDETTKPDDRPHIRVLENPYDIASFYRSQDGGSNLFGAQGVDGGGRYPIASFYRSNPPAGPYGYSRFWTSGYGGARALRRSAPYGVFGRRIGQNGDIFLLAPTFLAPVGPLTGIFFEK